jgi:hypothetical protein
MKKTVVRIRKSDLFAVLKEELRRLGKSLILENEIDMSKDTSNEEMYTTALENFKARWTEMLNQLATKGDFVKNPQQKDNSPEEIKRMRLRDLFFYLKKTEALRFLEGLDINKLKTLKPEEKQNVMKTFIQKYGEIKKIETMDVLKNFQDEKQQFGNQLQGVKTAIARLYRALNLMTGLAGPPQPKGVR